MTLKEKLDNIIKKGYTIDKEGSVKNPKGEIIEGSIYNGYRKYSLTNFTLRGHKFQAYIKYGDKSLEKGMVVRHKNNNSLDNSWDNILIGTQSDNMMDRPKEERVKHSEKKQYITEELKNKFIEDNRNGLSHRKIGEKYNIPYSTVMYHLQKR
jgi:hypothetical protein